MGAFLRRGGYAVTVARDRKSAETALAPRPSVAIIDSRLADMNGLDLIAPLRAAAPDLTIILVTHWPNPVLYAEAMQRGATTCLSKPFSLWNFWIILQQILRPIWRPGTPSWQARQALRIGVELPLRAHSPGSHRRWHGLLRDVSHTGAMVVLSTQLEAGQALVITLGPPQQAVRLKATVLWDREDALHPGVYLHGLQFAEPQVLEFAYDLARQIAPLPQTIGSQNGDTTTRRRQRKTRGGMRARAGTRGHGRSLPNRVRPR
jgi:CheY-like chemotaxis protein